MQPAVFQLHRHANQLQDAGLRAQCEGDTMADTSLWPIVLTGAFALGGSLGAMGINSFATARRDAAQECHEKARKRADKFEELVAAVFEFDHWLTLTRQRVLEKKEGIPETVSPFVEVQSISSIYFPQFSKLVLELDIVSSSYVAWIYNPQETIFSGTGKPRLFDEAFKPYLHKREALLDALTKFAREEFQ